MARNREYRHLMSIEEIRASALELPQDQRALLAASLLASLPAFLDDVDEGIAEAQRRSKEVDEEPSCGCSWQEIKENQRVP